MTEQPYAPPMASKAALASNAVRSHIYIAIRDALQRVSDEPAHVTLPDDGGPITVTAYGRVIQITTTDITDQEQARHP